MSGQVRTGATHLGSSAQVCLKSVLRVTECLGGSRGREVGLGLSNGVFWHLGARKKRIHEQSGK